ncbi:MAG: 4Fe-4S dicluster domain-containing protein [bacterium]
MRIQLSLPRQKPQFDFMNQLNEKLHTELRDCTACGICTACCPSRNFMEYAPMRVIELARLGEKDRLLNSKDPFACTDCKLCSQRCPVNIPVAEVFDELRMMAVATGAAQQLNKRKADFYQNFMAQAAAWGRLRPDEDIGWGGGPKTTGGGGGGIRGFFGPKKEKREPLNSIRDVTSFFDFDRRLKGIPDPEPPKVEEVKKPARGRR